MDARATWRIQVISNKIIKPSVPTPFHLKVYKLSLLDQLTTGSYIPIALFYPPNNPSNQNFQISEILEKSLSQLLTTYYPFCGTLLPDGNSVMCNDKGASFSEAVIKCTMSEFIEETDVRVQDCIFSNKLPWGNRQPEDYLFFVQVTRFECGGRALSFRVSHKIADGCTLINFLMDWAATNINLLEPASVCSGDHKRPYPQFTGSSLLPPINDRTTPSFTRGSNGGVVCKRFRFSGKSLTKLKSFVDAEDNDLLSSSSETKPRHITRVELVTAVLYKCAVTATAKTSPQLHGSTSVIIPSNLIQVANFRRLTNPKLEPNLVGNFYTYMDLVIENEEQMKLSRLVKEGKKAKLELQERMKQYYAGSSKNDLSKLVLENDKKMALRGEKDVYLCSSFCGYPIYDTDFGFGLPVWAILGSLYPEKLFFLMDTLEGDGVEALVTLEDKAMLVFENVEEIRSFASSI